MPGRGNLEAGPVMTLKQLLEQCGTVKVRTAPLLILIGAAMTADNGPDVETLVEMLDPPEEGTESDELPF